MKRQAPVSKKIIIGLTGSLGSGKTTVARIFKSLGADVIDADAIAREIISPGEIIYRRIVAEFHRDILCKNRTINRRKFARIIFSDRSALKKINSIMHPKIISIIKQRIKKTKGGVIVLDAPLLIEAGLQKIVDKLVVVKISSRQQMKRLKNLKKLNPVQARRIIKSQLPLSLKIRLADFVIDNNGSIAETRKQVELLRRQLWKN